MPDDGEMMTARFVSWMKHIVFMMSSDEEWGGREGRGISSPIPRDSFLKLSAHIQLLKMRQFVNFFPFQKYKNPLSQSCNLGEAHVHLCMHCFSFSFGKGRIGISMNTILPF